MIAVRFESKGDEQNSIVTFRLKDGKIVDDYEMKDDEVSFNDSASPFGNGFFNES